MSCITYIERYYIFFFSGQTFSPIAKWLELADIQFISKTTFYNYQHDYILPAIKKAYDISLKNTKDEINARSKFISTCMNYQKMFGFCFFLCSVSIDKLRLKYVLYLLQGNQLDSLPMGGMIPLVILPDTVPTQWLIL